MEAALDEKNGISLLIDFLDNSEIFKGKENRLDPDAFASLVEHHGLSYALGYMKAIFEITDVVSKVLYIPLETFNMDETPTAVINKVRNLHQALFNFLNEHEVDTSSIMPPCPHTHRLRHF